MVTWIDLTPLPLASNAVPDLEAMRFDGVASLTLPHPPGIRVLPSTQPMPSLAIAGATGPDTTFEFDGPEVVIGRHADAAIRLDGHNVSRRHARVARSGDAFVLEDLGSSNGTFLNGLRLEVPARLSDRDEIRIGGHVLRFAAAPARESFTILGQTAANAGNTAIFQVDPARKLQAVLGLAKDLGRSLDVDALLALALDRLFTLLPGAERGVAVLLEGGTPVLRAARARAGMPPAGFSASVVRRVAESGEGILAEDLADDDRFAGARSIVSLGVRSFICVPLPGQGGRSLGVLQVERTSSGHAFSTEDLHLLTALGLQIAAAVENARLHAELVARQRIEDEVAIAREIQAAHLPASVPDLPARNFDLHATLVPALEISGDFYDYFRFAGDRLLLVAGDVCGKGIPAALFMSMVRALLRERAEAGGAPGEILRDVNNAVARQNPKDQYVTLLLAILDPAPRTVEVASAGHPAPLLRRAGGKVEAVPVRNGPLLGFAERAAPYPQLALALAPGDMLLLYTDGVTEAPESESSMFGEQRLRAAFASPGAPADPAAWARSLIASVHAFARGRPQEDDITLVVLRVD